MYTADFDLINIRASNDDNHENENQGDDHNQTGLLIKTRPKTKKPSMYKVLLLNDDYTPMEFVVHILEKFFNKSRQEATDIMLHVHRRGVGLCAPYHEYAEHGDDRNWSQTEYAPNR